MIDLGVRRSRLHHHNSCGVSSPTNSAASLLNGRSIIFPRVCFQHGKVTDKYRIDAHKYNNRHIFELKREQAQWKMRNVSKIEE
jgi:hypothetical protein